AECSRGVWGAVSSEDRLRGAHARRTARDPRGVPAPGQAGARRGARAAGALRVIGSGVGKTRVGLGLLLPLALLVARAGVVLMLVGRVPWLGRLPGDIHFQRGNFSFYFPLATSLLLSVVLTLLLSLVGPL